MASFDGQQESERILFEIHPLTIVKLLAIFKISAITLIALVIAVIIGSLNGAGVVSIIGFGIAVFIFGVGYWWNNKYFADTRAYVTDRRIMRFERVTPLMITKRALFWNEAMKAKVYEPNLILQKFNIGTLIIEPAVPADENVIVHHIHYAEDLANYVDKILFTFKNNPADLASIKPFIPKPRGQRD